MSEKPLNLHLDSHKMEKLYGNSNRIRIFLDISQSRREKELKKFFKNKTQIELDFVSLQNFFILLCLYEKVMESILKEKGKSPNEIFIEKKNKEPLFRFEFIRNCCFKSYKTLLDCTDNEINNLTENKILKRIFNDFYLIASIFFCLIEPFQKIYNEFYNYEKFSRIDRLFRSMSDQRPLTLEICNGFFHCIKERNAGQDVRLEPFLTDITAFYLPKYP